MQEESPGPGPSTADSSPEAARVSQTQRHPHDDRNTRRTGLQLPAWPPPRSALETLRPAGIEARTQLSLNRAGGRKEWVGCWGEEMPVVAALKLPTSGEAGKNKTDSGMMELSLLLWWTVMTLDRNWSLHTAAPAISVGPAVDVLGPTWNPGAASPLGWPSPLGPAPAASSGLAVGLSSPMFEGGAAPSPGSACLPGLSSISRRGNPRGPRCSRSAVSVGAALGT